MSVSCDAGYGINSLGTACAVCTPGYFSSGGEGVSCTLAAVGTYASGYGATALAGDCADSVAVGAASCYSSKLIRRHKV
jgi:hypothetical protein